ncbi:CHC2 zinc finger domain-containing protein [Defluviimonas sp. CAU 1641]|uniref:CHC2 zinc finger domain-containing protein n=2 Tax=Defluviimonas salinarum TaxID=2992147 RepID=A0ABT3J4L8_9RHOB|nr:CHC2 zinc finger domain-containing protein [Defluviimonas salinarum]MCW3782611.1 CHC2 zinc finger domain-containing protein [Defluviimonas salinarum]
MTELKDRVKSAYPIDRALAELTGVTLKGRSGMLEGCCPFHVEKSPSFNVNVQKGRYRCFGAGCGAAGDVFSLICDTQNIDFRAAVLFGAERAGVEIPEPLRRDRRPNTGRQAARQAIRYPEARIQEAPETLLPSTFIPVRDGMRRPRAGIEFRIWENGGQAGDKMREEKRYFPAMVHEYRSISGDLLMSVMRIEFNGKKFFIPARLAEPSPDCPRYLTEKAAPGDPRLAWIVLGPRQGEAKPVFGLEHARAWNARGGRNVLIVEGEKTRDAAARLIAATDQAGDWLVLSPMGGGSSSIYADWEPLLRLIGDRPVSFTVWPDADKPLERPDGSVVDRQKHYVLQTLSALVQRAIDFGAPDMPSICAVTPPSGVESGWDIADAEREGWSPDRLRSYIEKHSSKVEKTMLSLRQSPTHQPETEERAGREAPAELAPFDVAADAAGDDSDWLDVIAALEQEGGDEAAPDDAQIRAGEDVSAEAGDAGAGSALPPGDLEANDGEDEGDEAAAGGHPLRNPHFRCLGYLDQVNYYMSLRSGQIFGLTASAMKPNSLLSLAPRDWWLEHFGGKFDRNGMPSSINWETAIDVMIAGSYDAGVWDPRLQCAQGARIDGGLVVFNTGSKLYVEGRNIVKLDRFDGRYCYCIGPSTRTPEVNNPFLADAAEVRQYLSIISSLDWRSERRELAIMALFGWTAISPICGILKWRPHLWLDGQRGSGKSWIVNNLIKPVLGDYVVNVLSNSSEPGIRNMLNGRSVPVIFDEAEGEDRDNRARMDAIIRMARHSAVESNSVVAQGVSGGGSHRYYSIASTFLMTSIVPQLEAAADRSRFARLQLASGRKHEGFTRDIEIPASALLTPEFSDRFIGRMIRRAGDYHKTYMHMVHGLCSLGLERRVADVYGTFATGCWLMLRDGIPADEREAAYFISSEFNVIEQMLDFNSEISEDKDHDRLFREIMSHEVRLDGRNAGSRSEQVGSLMEIACGYESEDDAIMSQDEAREVLLRYGMRPGIGDTPCLAGQVATHMLIHKNAAPIRNMLDKTPYARSYPDVMHQADGVKMGKTVRFGPGMGISRSIIVPLKHFSIGVDNA